MKKEYSITNQDKLKELSRNITIATSSIIPGVGGVLSLFLDKHLPSTIEKRKEDFLKSLSNDLEQLPTEIIDKLSTNEEYHSIILKVFKSITQEEKEMKLIAFRNILINEALCDSHINEREFYIKLLTDLTTDQIRVLHLFLRDHKKEIEFTKLSALCF